MSGLLHNKFCGRDKLKNPFSFLSVLKIRLHFPASLAVRYYYVTSYSQWDVGRSDVCLLQAWPI